MKKTLIAIVAVLAFAGCENPTETTALYSAWKSANPDHAHLTQDEWKVLRKNDMLPGVDYAKKYAKDAKDSAEAAAVFSATNMIESSGSKK